VSRIFLGHSSANEAEAIAGTPAMMHQTAESIDTLVKNVGSYSPTCPGEKGIRVRACIELALDWPWIGPGRTRGNASIAAQKSTRLSPLLEDHWRDPTDRPGFGDGGCERVSASSAATAPMPRAYCPTRGARGAT
jgi:hypothetical protein